MKNLENHDFYHEELLEFKKNMLEIGGLRKLEKIVEFCNNIEKENGEFKNMILRVLKNNMKNINLPSNKNSIKQKSISSRSC